MTPFQLADSAKAPWTRTTVGFSVDMTGLPRGLKRCRSSLGAPPAAHQEEVTQKSTSSFSTLRTPPTIWAGRSAGPRSQGGAVNRPRRHGTFPTASALREVGQVAGDLPRFLSAPLFRRRHRTLGATQDEAAATMPGDELLP